MAGHVHCDRKGFLVKLGNDLLHVHTCLETLSENLPASEQSDRYGLRNLHFETIQKCHTKTFWNRKRRDILLKEI